MPKIDRNQRDLAKALWPWALLAIVIVVASEVICSLMGWGEQWQTGIVAGAIYLGLCVIYVIVHFIRSRLRATA